MQKLSINLTLFSFIFDQMFTNSSFYSLFQHNLNRYERNEVIRRIFASIVRFFWFFGKRFVESRSFFQSKTICIPRGIIPKNFSSLGLAMLKEIENKQSNKQIDSLTSYLFRGRVYQYLARYILLGLGQLEEVFQKFIYVEDNYRK